MNKNTSINDQNNNITQPESNPSDNESLNVSETLIIELQSEVQKNLIGWQKAQADYVNLQKETERERKSLILFSNQRMIEKFIPLFDSFDIAIKNLPEELQEDTWVNGVKFIYKQMLQILLDEGVEIINPVEQDFNPHEHEAVAIDQEVKTEGNTQKVLEVFQVGYKLHTKIIRSARVKVSA